MFADFKADRRGRRSRSAPTSRWPATTGREPPAAEIRTAEVDGYTVTLDGDLTAGDGRRADAVSVGKDGRPVTDLEPYLGAYGHLVALREGDLAYLHVHPDGDARRRRDRARAGRRVLRRGAQRGGYRLFLDFQHDGVVRTAAVRPTLQRHREDGGRMTSH